MFTVKKVVASGRNSDQSDAEKVYTEEELNAMTIANIKAIAEQRGYTITKTVKAEIIAEFLSAQNS